MAGTWTVPGVVRRIIDADTILLDLDLGWRIHLEQSVRLWGCNAPERDTEEGALATAFVAGLLAPGDRVTVVSHRQLGQVDNYGRILASIRLADDTDLTAALLGSGHADPYPSRA